MSQPTDTQIRTAAQQMQQGGSSRLADQLVRQSGNDGPSTAARILEAAADYPPNN